MTSSRPTNTPISKDNVTVIIKDVIRQSMGFCRSIRSLLSSTLVSCQTAGMFSFSLIQDAYAKKLVTSEFSKTMEWNQSPRPCYDMVEEYNRSLDEYKDKVCSIAYCIIRHFDFLLRSWCNTTAAFSDISY